MFDVSFSEVLVIGVVALLVIGPEKLPKVARTVGAFAGRMQRYVAQVKEEVNREVRFEELQKLQLEIKQSVEQQSSAVQSSFNETFNSERIDNDSSLIKKSTNKSVRRPSNKSQSVKKNHDVVVSNDLPKLTDITNQKNEVITKNRQKTSPSPQSDNSELSQNLLKSDRKNTLQKEKK